MSVGERLRRARLDAGLPLDHVSDTTKIPLWILHSIERDDLSHVPGGVFVRGYLASFARAVGADVDEILTAHFGPPRAPAAVSVPDVRRPIYTGTPLWQVAALIALIVVTAVVWRDAWRGDPDAAAPPARTSRTTAARVSATEHAAAHAAVDITSPALTPTAVPVSAVERTAPPVVTAANVEPAPAVSESAVAPAAPPEPTATGSTEPSEPAASNETDAGTATEPPTTQ